MSLVQRLKYIWFLVVSWVRSLGRRIVSTLQAVNPFKRWLRPRPKGYQQRINPRRQFRKALTKANPTLASGRQWVKFRKRNKGMLEVIYGAWMYQHTKKGVRAS